MADVKNYALIVYDAKKNSSWKIKNPFFQYDPKFNNFFINGENFTINDGVIGMAINPKKKNFYFHSMASLSENSVGLDVLNDIKAFTKNESAHLKQFKRIGIR
jgi:hypothetical protein